MKYLPTIDSPQDLKKLSVDQMIELAAEMRQMIVSTVAKTGGHLASNLGSVEITLALHYIFNFPIDKLIWDVSHQTYGHKLITGRRDRFHTLRQYDGIAGYAKRDESEYDPFGAAHASTSISAALGFAAARDLAGKQHEVVAVIGDGAMTGGLAFEGLNNAGSLNKDLLVILNDNTWSISKNVGAISKYFTSLMADEKVNKLRAEIWELTGKFKRREKIRETISRIEDSVKGLVVPGMLFEKMGFRYFGPIDGHDLPLLVRTLDDLSKISGPRLLHVATKKGKGYQPAEGNAFKYHGVGKFDKVTGKAEMSAGARPAYTKVFADSLIEMAAKDDKVVAITAAMASGTGLVEFGETYPDRFFDVGIAEAHAGCFAAGLAADGYKPYLAIYSTFLQRAYDQIIHDIGIQNLPVVMCMDRAGVVGDDGPTHHGCFDLAYLAAVPNVKIAAPKDGNELRSMLHYTANHDMKGPWGIRYPREAIPTDLLPDVQPIEWGTWERLTSEKPVIIIAVGTMVMRALDAAAEAAKQGVDVAVVNARFVKPFDYKMLGQLRKQSSVIITAEEGTHRGGFGQAVAEYLLENQYEGAFKALAIPDQFVVHGARPLLLRDLGLDADGILKSIMKVVDPLRSDDSDDDDSRTFLQKLMFRKNGKQKREAGEQVRMTGTDHS